MEPRSLNAYDGTSQPRRSHGFEISKATIAGPWNKGCLVEQKLPLKLREIWAIRIRLQLSE